MWTFTDTVCNLMLHLEQNFSIVYIRNIGIRLHNVQRHAPQCPEQKLWSTNSDLVLQDFIVL